MGRLVPLTVIPAFVVGHRDYVWTGDAREPGEPTLSSAPRVLHAALVAAPGPDRPWFQRFRHATVPWRSLCGVELLAVSPEFFDEATPWSCRVCGTRMNRWLDDVDLVRGELLVAPEVARSGG